MPNPVPVLPTRSPYSSNGNDEKPNLPRNLMPPTPGKNRARRKFIFLFVFSLLIAVITYFVAKQYSSLSQITIAHEGDNSAVLTYDSSKSSSQLDPNLFKQAGDGRFNVVVVGVGGENHPGSYLTDSIQVVSLDTINKKVGITSVPRDMYVKVVGNEHGKINSVYFYAEQNKVGSGALAVRNAVGSVLGIKISNFVLLDFSGAKDVVDALGGIDVDVPKAIYDPFFPDDTTVGYSPFNITAGLHHMDGNTALRYSRSRETTSDFDRSARQQLVIAAIKQKALSTQTLTNPVKISNLISALGSHIRTDMSVDQIKTFLNIYKNISNTDTATNVLDTSDKLGLLTATTDPVAGYIEYPILGYDDFSAVGEWFQKNNPDPLIIKEAATVTLASNGKASAKQLQEIATTLQDYGYKVTLSTTVADSSTTQTQVYETSHDAKPFSRNYLATFFATNAQRGHPLDSGADLEIIYVPTHKK